jgi:Zn-finger nucleic acid-binding protein
MKCSIRNVDLKAPERQGLEVNSRRQCRGVWLDRAELDTIIERSKDDGRPRSPHPVPDYYNHHQRDCKYVCDDHDATADGVNARIGRNPAAADSTLTRGVYEQCCI